MELKAESGDGEVKRERESPKARRHAAVELLDRSGQW